MYNVYLRVIFIVALGKVSLGFQGILRNLRREASCHFRNKKREYFKGKVTDIELTVRIRTSETCITEFKKVYQPKTNLVKGERGDLLADPEKILKGGRITSVSNCMYRGQGVLGGPKFTQQSHLCQSLVPLSLRSLSER
jgi:hypothetical protein